MAVGTKRTVAGLVLAAVVALGLPEAVAAPAADSDEGSDAGTAPGDEPTQKGGDAARDSVRREAEELAPFLVGTTRVRLLWPLQVAGAVGVLTGKRPASWECDTVCEFRGFHAQAELGIAGAQLAAGWASLVGDTRPKSRWISNVYSGWAIRAALMRTGGTSTLTPEWQTFAGIEGTLSATRGSLSLAVYHRVSDTPSNDPWLIGAGLGWGF